MWGYQASSVRLARGPREWKRNPQLTHLLPKEFTLTQLQILLEAIFNEKMDKRNFRKKVAKLDYIKSAGKKALTGSYRPAELFCFDHRKYRSPHTKRRTL